MTGVQQATHEAVTAAVDELVARLVSDDPDVKPHLARALVAERVSAVAHHRTRDEVAAALQEDGATWDEVAHAFGLSVDDAQHHFGTRPSGLPE